MISLAFQFRVSALSWVFSLYNLPKLSLTLVISDFYRIYFFIGRNVFFFSQANKILFPI